jgi:hypothetical protein
VRIAGEFNNESRQLCWQPCEKGAFTIEITHNKGILYEWSYHKGFIRSINFLSLKFTVEEAA